MDKNGSGIDWQQSVQIKDGDVINGQQLAAILEVYDGNVSVEGSIPERTTFDEASACLDVNDKFRALIYTASDRDVVQGGSVSSTCVVFDALGDQRAQVSISSPKMSCQKDMVQVDVDDFYLQDGDRVFLAPPTTGLPEVPCDDTDRVCLITTPWREIAAENGRHEFAAARDFEAIDSAVFK